MLVSFVFLCVVVVARAQSDCVDGGAWAVGFVKVSASIVFGRFFVVLGGSKWF